MPFVTVPDGTQLYYEEDGAGEPLLLVSGQRQDHTFWDGVRDDFSDRYRVIVYDNRGAGQSDKPTDPPYSTGGSPVMPSRCSTTLVCSVPTRMGIPWAEGSASGWASIMVNGLGRSCLAPPHQALRMAFPCRRKSMHCGSTRRQIHNRPSKRSGPCSGRRPGSRRTLVTPGR